MVQILWVNALSEDTYNIKSTNWTHGNNSVRQGFERAVSPRGAGISTLGFQVVFGGIMEFKGWPCKLIPFALLPLSEWKCGFSVSRFSAPLTIKPLHPPWAINQNTLFLPRVACGPDVLSQQGTGSQHRSWCQSNMACGPKGTNTLLCFGRHSLKVLFK